MTDDTNTNSSHRVLATDLDGTLIPLNDNAQNRADLKTLSRKLEEHAVTLVYVTGRHLESAADAIKEHHLPQPAWLISDVGTSIYERNSARDFYPINAYQEHQDEIIAATPLQELLKQLKPIDGLRLQEPWKQGRFKLSFYADASRLSFLVKRIQMTLCQSCAPWTIIDSVDPFNGDGLIDLLPAHVSKSYALGWWVKDAGINPDEIVFAGDSGNDLAALTGGYRAILVGNADPELAAEVDRLHRASGWTNRLHFASGQATSGVLEGCQRFGLFD